ncbi:MAG: hypothetical protein Q9217_004926 [Psora testacea]
MACSTRLTSGRRYKSKLASHDSKQMSIPLPYWLPYFGHFFQLFYNWRAFLGKTSKAAYQGALPLHVLGRKCILIVDPRLAKTIIREHAPFLDFNIVRWRLLINVFGADSRHQQAYYNIQKHAQATLGNDHLISSLGAKVRAEIQSRAPELVSFSDSIVDQNVWERPAGAYVTQQPYGTKRRPVVEVSFFTLIKNFVGQAYLTAILGSEFMELFPSVLEDLSTLDDGWKHLVLGFPRWMPIRSLNKAHMAHRRLQKAIKSFHKALDAHARGEEPQRPWRDLSDVSALMKERRAFCRHDNTPPRIEEPAVLALIWGLYTKAASETSWTLLQIWATPGMVDQIRHEIQRHVKATQRLPVLGVPEPAQLSIDTSGLMNSCALLKACLCECVRLQCSPMSVGKVDEGFTVSLNKTTSDISEHSKSFRIEAGTYVVAMTAFSAKSEPKVLEDHGAFKPERWLSQNSEPDDGEVLDKTGPEAGGEELINIVGLINMEKEVLALVAGILALWEVSPTPSREWVVPKQRWSSVFAQPESDVRVRLSSRNLLE